MKNKKKILLSVALLLLSTPYRTFGQTGVPVEGYTVHQAPERWKFNVALKTNLLYGAAALTPNLGVELGVGPKSTVDVGLGYNWFNLYGTTTDNRKLVHWLASAEYRYWLCGKFNGHFFGVHLLASHYNISQHELPLLFGAGSGQYRYQGWAFGAGVSYGYQWTLGHRWSLEASVGLGYASLSYDRYDCILCGNKQGSAERRNYIGPTKAALSLIYLF